MIEKYLKVNKKKSVLESLNNYFLDYTPKNIESSKSLLSDQMDFSTKDKSKQKKGIRRTDLDKPVKNSKFDDYGIWVASKVHKKP